MTTATPQLLAYVSELLLEAGAWDVYRAAVQMKKGRTGVQMTVLSSPDLLPALRELLLRETTTHRPALAAGKQDGPGAGVRRGGDAVGQGADEDRALAVGRGGECIAGVRGSAATSPASTGFR